MKFKDVIQIYNTMVAEFENFMFTKVLPPILRVMLFGMKITLAWAFYQTIKNVGREFL